MSSLKTTLETILDPKVELNIIHLERSIERVPSINNLESSIQSRLKIVDAIDGSNYKDHCRNCPFETTCWICNNSSRENKKHLRGYGEIGCLLSHLKIWRNFLDSSNNYCVIFEDDCRFVGNLDSLNKTLLDNIEILKNADILLIGSLSYRNKQSNINNQFCSVVEFDGTHSMIINRYAAQCCIDFYTESVSNNYLYPVDSLYFSIKNKYQINIVGINNYNKYFIQDTSLTSTIQQHS